MDLQRFERTGPTEWRVHPVGAMRVPAILYADADLVAEMDDKAWEQMTNVATLPGIVRASYAMPDAHWGYGFPIGGVAAFDADSGLLSGGGVGFDVSCGVRTLLTGIDAADLGSYKEELATRLFEEIPAGVGSTGSIHLDADEMTDMLLGGAAWAVGQGYGHRADLDRIEEGGQMQGALPEHVSGRAKRRQRDEMGTLGSGNHYLELQRVTEVFDPTLADAFGLSPDSVVVSIHSGSRGLGHQVGTDYLRAMAMQAAAHGVELPDRELASVPIRSSLGQAYLGAMRAAINCALANRQILTHLVREVFEKTIGGCTLALLYDVSHNTCKEETHKVDGQPRRLFVHRKGATRAFGPGHNELPADLRPHGQPVLVGGTMGTESYVLVGTLESESRAFSSACHGAGRRMSRNRAAKHWRGEDVMASLLRRGIVVRCPSSRGIAEEAPGAYKNVSRVVEVSERAGLARRVARLEPLVCIKG